MNIVEDLIKKSNRYKGQFYFHRDRYTFEFPEWDIVADLPYEDRDQTLSRRPSLSAENYLIAKNIKLYNGTHPFHVHYERMERDGVPIIEYPTGDHTFTIMLKRLGLYLLMKLGVEKSRRLLVMREQEGTIRLLQDIAWGPRCLTLKQIPYDKPVIDKAYFIDHTALNTIDFTHPFSPHKVYPRGPIVSKRWYTPDGRWKDSQYEYMAREIKEEYGVEW